MVFWHYYLFDLVKESLFIEIIQAQDFRTLLHEDCLRDTAFRTTVPAFQLMRAAIPEFFKSPVCAEIVHITPAADAALESTDYLTRLDAYTFHEGFAHLLSYQATEIDCVDWHTPQLTEVAAASRAKLRLALTETDSDRQKQFLEEAVCGSYYEKFACMCGMLYLADRWETQGIDGLQSAFADYHGFAQRALSI